MCSGCLVLLLVFGVGYQSGATSSIHKEMAAHGTRQWTISAFKFMKSFQTLSKLSTVTNKLSFSLSLSLSISDLTPKSLLSSLPNV